MTSKLVVNTIEADTGISSVSFASSISMSSTSKFHFSAAGVDIGADTNINRPAAGVLGFNINGAEKVRIDTNGHIHGVGVVTATHFYGNGSNLTSLPAQATIANNADNRVITGGSGVNLNGEANLTYDGLDLVVNGTGDKAIRWATGGANKWSIYHNNSAGALIAYDNANSAERVRIDSSGQVSIGGNSSVGTKVHVENSSGDAHIRLRGSANCGVLYTRHSDGALIGYTGSGNAVNLGSSNLGISASLSNGDIIFQTGGTASSNERLRITSDGRVRIGQNDSVYGQLSLSIPAQSGGAALQVMNTAAGSGDGTLTNIVLRSVNNAGSQWSMAEYRAHYHKFLNQGTEVLRTQVSGDYGSVETRNAKTGYGGYAIVSGASHVFMGDANGAGLYNDTDNGWYMYGAKGGDTFLYSNGSQTFRSYVTGDYGCVQTLGTKNGFGGLSVSGQYNFMADANACGIYNDIDNEWMAYFARNSSFILYHNGEGVLTSDSNGPIVTTHNHLKLNQGNWTGEYAGKMQFHSGYMYNQSSTGWIFRDDGTNGNYDVYTINQTGGVTTSDERLKENIETIPDALNKVNQLKGRSFDFKSSGIKSQGVIAQEVEQILPDIVTTTPVINGEESYKKVNYGALSGVFIEAIKELKAKIETLETKVATLEGS